MKLKTIFFLLLIFITSAIAQKTEQFGLICTYDYISAIKDGTNFIVDEVDPPFHLCWAESNGKTFKIKERKSFHEIIDFGKTKNILLYVHGDGTNVDELIKRGYQLPGLYNTRTLFFAWPSYEIDHNRIANYKTSKNNVNLTFDRFIQTIDSLSIYAQNNNVKVTLFFHSLGNTFAKQYARYLQQNPNRQLPFDNIILNAACVWTQDHFYWVDILANRVKNKVYINYNDKDRILAAANLYIEGQLLLGQTQNIEFVSYHPNVVYMDFSQALDYKENDSRFSNSHTYFLEEAPLENKIIHTYFYNTCNGGSVNLNDTTVFGNNAVYGYKLKN